MDAAIEIIESGFKPSNNDYDWLGEGVYFWQDAPIRAKQWAQSVSSINRSSNQEIETIRSVFVEGEDIYPNSAIYDLGHVQIAVRNTQLIKESIIINIDRI